jgi:D-alanyl-lipoteichoic acid acyltransferase DltB (MBOAT superfamily)
MFTSLLSFEFLIFAPVVVAFVAATTGRLREIGFLAANLGFVYAIIGLSSLISTLVFCLLGWGLTKVFTSATQRAAVVSATLFIAIFIYMRDYEFLGWFLPNDLRLSSLQTVGLSFLLFRILHVMIDARGQMIDRIEPLTYANYLLAFPTFMMGPIQRFQDFRDQWSDRTRAIPMTFEAHLDAGLRILWGFVKVYVFGSVLNRFALQPDTDVLSLSAAQLWIQLAGFYFYLFFNFSGYCDIVIGVGSLMGVRPPENFNSPYIAQNISDFWLRQHRSLTLWLTDYVFNPFYKWALGSRLFASSLVAGILAALLTMLISGIWHGTTVGFLIFGLVHGTWLAIYRVWDHVATARLGRKRIRQIRSTLPGRVVGILLTFHAAAFAFLFFRLDTPSLLSLIGGLY